MERSVSVAWLVFLVGVANVGVFSEPFTGTSEQSMYHLSEVRRNVDLAKRLLATPATRRVFKRSTDVNADDLFLHSVASYCDSFQTNPDILKYFEQKKANQPLSATDISGYYKFTPSQKSHDISTKWEMNLKVFPVRIQAQREGEVVWVIFHIAHSEAATVSRIDPFDFQTSDLDMPEDSCQTIVSKSRFHINVSSICNSSPEEFEGLEFGFQITSAERSSYVTTVYFDLCDFNPNRNSKISTPIETPIFRMGHSDNDVILLESNGSAVFDFDVHIIGDYAIVSLHLLLWNPETKEAAKYSAFVYIWRNTELKVRYSSINSQVNSSNKGQHIRVNIMKSNLHYGLYRNVTLRVLVENVSENQEGKLTLRTYQKIRGSLYSTQVERSLEVKHRGTPNRKPQYSLYFDPRHTFQCDKYNGDLHDKDVKFGHNCTVRCHAYGRDISNIFISRLGDKPLPVMSASYVLPGDAVAIMNVGEASPDNEGEYQCVAVDKQGRARTHDINLYTSHFTEITRFDLLTENKTAILNCTAVGDGDLEMFIFVSKIGEKETRVDIDKKFEKNRSSTGNTSTLVLAVPWDELKLPRNNVRCLVKGKRGEDYRENDLTGYRLNSEGVFPQFLDDETKAIYYPANDTFSLKCSASGAQPMRMWISLSDRFPGQTPINSTESNVGTAVETNGKIMSTTYYNIPKRVSRDMHYFYCKASNEFSSASQVFFALP